MLITALRQSREVSILRMVLAEVKKPSDSGQSIVKKGLWPVKIVAKFHFDTSDTTLQLLVASRRNLGSLPPGEITTSRTCSASQGKYVPVWTWFMASAVTSVVSRTMTRYSNSPG